MSLPRINPTALVIVIFFIALTSCTSVTNRSYSQPVAYVKFAAQEACLTAGGQLTPSPVTDKSMQIKATRGMLVGLLLGQGGETIQVDLSDNGGRTDVTVTSRKRGLGFFAQRHVDERVAEFLDKYLSEDIRFEAMIVNSSTGAQP